MTIVTPIKKGTIFLKLPREIFLFSGASNRGRTYIPQRGIFEQAKHRRNISNYARITLKSKSDDIKAKQAKAKENSLANLRKEDKPRLCNVAQSEKPADRTDLTKELAKKTGAGEQTASRVLVINKKIDKAIVKV